jgi:UDP-2,3-diacylglucosamine pyrophosphatase LpxH
MLVVISDLHLDDGSCAKSLSADAFHIFRERLELLARAASLRTDGTYRPIESIDLLLLGDIFELIHSTLWLAEKPGEAGYARPWINPTGAELAAKIQAITEAILTNNAEALAVLRQMAKGEAISLPPADAQGKPALDSAERIPIKVNLYYMVGNHDWFYHLPGKAYRHIRHQVIKAMGLQNPPAPFPHEPRDWDSLVRLLEKYRIFARHGDCFDKWNYNRELGRNAATLADALSIELLNRFPEEVEKRIGDALPEHFYRGLHEFINVRPIMATPLWIGSQLHQHDVSAEMRVQVKAIWDELVDDFLSLDFVRDQGRKRNPFENVDGLELVLKLTRWTSVDNLDRAILLIQKKLWSDDLSFAKHAMNEKAFVERQADYIVYGHTHHHETIPLDAYHHEGQDFYQFLVNTGTWRSCYDLTRYHPEQQKFVPYQPMSYLAFYKGDERHGRRHESWSGRLV